MREGARADGRLPLTIIGGFLGAGKSTWLRHQLYRNAFGAVHVLVNEAAEMPVDNLLLGKAERVSVLAGGCACCDGRGALVAALRGICGEQDRPGSSRIDRILLETSGLADPSAIAELLSADSMLARRLVLEDVFVMVDAVHGPVQLREEALGRRQVETAGRLIVTKPREVPPRQVARLVNTLRQLNPVAPVEGAENGVSFGLPSAPDAEPYPLPDLVGASAGPIRPCRLDISGGNGWAAVSVWLSALLTARGDDIVRVKGVVTGPDGRLLLQSVRKQVQPPEMLPEPKQGGSMPETQDDVIVLIGRGIDEALLAHAWKKFAMVP